jgi:hypothetical protein
MMLPAVVMAVAHWLMLATVPDSAPQGTPVRLLSGRAPVFPRRAVRDTFWMATRHKTAIRSPARPRVSRRVDRNHHLFERTETTVML